MAMMTTGRGEGLQAGAGDRSEDAGRITWRAGRAEDQQPGTRRADCQYPGRQAAG